MKKIAFALTFLALAGCRHAPPPVSHESMTYPELGTVATEGVGEPLLMQASGTSVGAIVVPEDQKIGDFLIRKGKYSTFRQNAEYQGFNGVKLHNTVTNAEKPGFLYLFSKDKGTKTVCVSRSICGEMNYSIDRATQMNANFFQQTLIYSGKIGDKITVGYRESSGSNARPAFNNDVTYDLSTSNIIGYKGARLEVIKATNTEITYKVLADFK